MHTTADDPSRYQAPEQLEAWEKRDPLPRFRNYLHTKGVWSDESQTELEAEVKKRIEDAVKAFESRTDFKPDAPFDHVFGTEHPRIEEQRAQFLDALQKESADG